jgi:hypothetical protein
MWVGLAYLALGQICREMGDYEASLRQLEEVLRIARMLGDRRREAFAMSEYAHTGRVDRFGGGSPAGRRRTFNILEQMFP